MWENSNFWIERMCSGRIIFRAGHRHDNHSENKKKRFALRLLYEFCAGVDVVLQISEGECLQPVQISRISLNHPFWRNCKASKVPENSKMYLKNLLKRGTRDLLVWPHRHSNTDTHCRTLKWTCCLAPEMRASLFQISPDLVKGQAAWKTGKGELCCQEERRRSSLIEMEFLLIFWTHTDPHSVSVLSLTPSIFLLPSMLPYFQLIAQ